MTAIINANSLHIPLADNTVQCVVTSPPYWSQRDYGVDGQIGLEPTPAEYVARIVYVMRECWRVMKDDGTLWLNLGDTYHQGNKGQSGEITDQRCKQATNKGSQTTRRGDNLGPNRKGAIDGLKPKDLCGIPWRVAFALQDDGWYLRSDIIWSKPNPMPESVTDRPTKSHEYIFLLAKSDRYYYDADAIAEDCSPNTHMRISQDLANQVGSFRANGGNKTNGPMKAVIKGSTRKIAESGSYIKANQSYESAMVLKVEKRNRRTVWTVGSTPYSGAHFATFPPALIEPMILASSRPGDIVLDPFVGSGTTLRVCLKHGRRGVGLDLNERYLSELATDRTRRVQTAMQL